MTPTCPRCKQAIPSEDINVAKDIAFCRNCDLSHRLSDLATGLVVDDEVDVNRPPAGVWYERNNCSVVIGATHRSLGQAFGLLFFCLFWNGIVSVFLSMAVISTLQHLGVTLSSWVHPPTSRGGPVPVGLTIFLWIFLTPFIAVGFILLGAFLSSLAGRTQIRIEDRQGTLSTGIGPLSFRKRFSTAEVRGVQLEERPWRDSRGNSRCQTQIVIETDGNPIKFGSMLSPERRRFVASALKKELVRS